MDAMVKFGAFELDRRTHELRKRGIRLQVRGQSIEILEMLVERAGDLVMREEIQQRLWPDGTIVEFEHSVNSAVNRLRDVLGDSPTKPRYIETVPRRGYRFIAQVNSAPSSTAVPVQQMPGEPAEPASRVRPTVNRQARWALVLVSLAVAVLAAWRIAGSRSGRPWKIRSLAVLPLLNMSPDTDQEYFADGMTEALTSDLGKMEKLRVISRTSAMTYKGTRKPLRTIAKELNVDALVEGSVLRSGGRVRIVAQLIDSSDAHMWTGTYERDVRDVLQLQSEVAQAIAREVRAALSPEEQARIAATGPVKPEAYEAYLKGMFHLNKSSPEGFERGILYLQKAADIDPSDPFAHAALALGYAMMGHDRYPDAFGRARAAAIKSLSLGGPLAEAHTALAMQELYWDWDLTAAGKDLERALELKPNFAEARRNLSWHLRLIGRRREGIEEMRRAASLDPLSPQVAADLAWQLLNEGEFDGALAEAQKCLELSAAFPQGLAIVGWVYAQKGLAKEATAAHERAASADPMWKWPLGRTYALFGRQAEAEAIAAELGRSASPMGRWGSAVIYAALHDTEGALQGLEAAYASRFSWMPWNNEYAVPSQDIFAPLRSDPRYQDLMRRVGVPLATAN